MLSFLFNKEKVAEDRKRRNDIVIAKIKSKQQSKSPDKKESTIKDRYISEKDSNVIRVLF